MNHCECAIFKWINHHEGAGDFLKPMLVFQGKSGGRIEHKFNDYPDGCINAVQERAWMDEMLMLCWVEEILKPWVKEAQNGIVPYIL